MKKRQADLLNRIHKFSITAFSNRTLKIWIDVHTGPATILFILFQVEHVDKVSNKYFGQLSDEAISSF